MPGAEGDTGKAQSSDILPISTEFLAILITGWHSIAST